MDTKIDAELHIQMIKSTVEKLDDFSQDVFESAHDEINTLVRKLTDTTNEDYKFVVMSALSIVHLETAIRLENGYN